ncbi:MAG: hypothetical protein JWL85_308 [Candidatus Saccharibacteria bacterium]|nr:hypothetical protein [Candidatus Saccharibacteria bacterium]
MKVEGTVNSDNENQPITAAPKKPRSNKVKYAVTAVVAGGIFVFGVMVGNGRVPIGPDAVFQKSVSKNLPADLDYSSVEQMYDKLRQSYDGQLDANKLLDGLKGGLAKATGDPYTEFLNVEEAKQFDEELNGTFSGIGAELSKDKNAIIVVSPIAGFPAEKAGLKSKDVIVEIDGQSAYDLNLTEAVNKIRGPEGTKVKLKVMRNGTQELNLEITREKITIPSVTSEVVNGNIGIIKISRFSDDTAQLTREAAQKFKDQNVKGVVLDVRGNPGGLLDAAVDVSSVWLPAGKTVLQEKRDGVVVRTFSAKGTPILEGVPTVVLIDEGSASASEITAGALKDNNAATLIGQKSFGKGSVQQLERLPDGSVLKVTIARWYTPAGKNIDKEGIEPNQKVERTDEDFKNNRDPQKDAAVQALNK